MGTMNYTPGQSVRILSDAIGTIRLDDPYHFTENTYGAGTAGVIYSSPGAMPEGWLLVKIDGTDEYAPVHPRMICPAEDWEES